MSRQVLEIEAVMQQLIAEHGKLLACMETHQKAMKSLDLKLMEDAGNAQEACRLRIATLETRRRAMVQAVMRTMRVDGQPTLTRLAELFPNRRDALLKLRSELLAWVEQIQQRTNIGGKVAGAVLGHLNTVVRVLAGAVEQAGVYGKHGLPVSPARMGVMEAVG
jgi:hypothetical protein